MNAASAPLAVLHMRGCAQEDWQLDFAAWMQDVHARMEAVLDALLPPAAAEPARLHDAMRYAVLGGGKRVRPLLVFAAGAVVEAALDALDRPAAAVEMIHAYSLIHDDLPSMDDDALRRGKPTVHIEFDEATAILAGDALHAQAVLVMTHHTAAAVIPAMIPAGIPAGITADRTAGAAPVAAPGAAERLEMLHLLAQASGSRGMCGGQQIDLDATGKTLSEAELEWMHIHKTGALIRASVTLGALCGKPLSETLRGRLDHYAKCIGLLFQVVDDILDATADTATLGKTAGKDKKAGKPTYVSILGLAAARRKAQDLHADALAALEPFGVRAQRLRELAHFIAKRRF